MPQPVDNHIARRTREYWDLSSAYNGRTKTPLTAEKANKQFSNILPQLNPARPVARRLNELQAEIIRGPQPQHKAKHNA